jgi:ABC-type uncharacterized transport system substrate-binding protein
MNRREVIGGLLATLSKAALAEEKVWRIGYITPGSERGRVGSIQATVFEELAREGFVEGKNFVLIPAAAEGDITRLPQLAERLAQERVDLIIAAGTPAVRAAMKASPNIPIVLSFVANDPVEAGFAATLARPGGMVTGVFFRSIENEAKRLELLKEAQPSARLFGFLAAPTLEAERSELLARTAAHLGISLTTRVVHGPEDYVSAFDAFQKEGVVGVLIHGTTIFVPHASRLAGLARQRGIATMCEWDFMARDDGCMLGYGPDLIALRRLSGRYVVQILKGTPPGELPILQPDRYALAINLRTAAEINVQLPASILVRADEVIE